MRRTGDEWLVYGLSTYYPRVEEQMGAIAQRYVVTEGTALKMKATRDFTDKNGVSRNGGEQYLIRELGSYICNVYEEFIELVKAQVLTAEKAIQLKATTSFTDVYGVKRSAGDDWLVTDAISSTHIVDVNEILVKSSNLVVLASDEYVVVHDTWCKETNRNLFGDKKVFRGPHSFFMYPRERTPQGISKIIVLSENGAVLVKATEKFSQHTIQNATERKQITDLYKAGKKEQLALIKNERSGHIRCVLKSYLKESTDNEVEYKTDIDMKFWIEDKIREAGEKWMEYGPQAYLPPVEVSVVSQTAEIPLDKNEGVYVRDNLTGAVRAVEGESYMIKPHESLAPIEIGAMVRDILEKQSGPLDLTRLVTYKCPFNACVQIFNYREKTSRIVFGPKLVKLGPQETFTVNVLSGGKPKVPGMIKSLYIALGPDFTSDMIEVETSDHCRMNVKLSYNWHFKVDPNDLSSAAKLFAIRDFIGDMCTNTASRIRSAVASVNFDNFHKGFARMIREAIFGKDENGKIKDSFLIEKNGLCLTNVDISSVEPIDMETKKSLKQTVAQAIEVTSSNQKDEAIRDSKKTVQEAEGQLERLKIDYQTKAEAEKKVLLSLQAESQSIKESGKAIAESRAMSEADKLMASSNVKVSSLEAKSSQIHAEAKLRREKEIEGAHYDHEAAMVDLRIHRKKSMADIEAKKFEGIMEALGQEALISIANSGIENQKQMLEGLGLKGYLLTDGQTPVNLFSAAQGLIGKGEKTQEE